ncbi:MAG: putative baseplate assembly protein [Methanothrix sp.]
MSCNDTGKSPCSCCKLPTPATPAVVENRPGMSSLSYRVGTYDAFRQAMFHAISQRPDLESWMVRTSDDYGIALIEMWAYLADILTFYQERIANEAYLRTALLPESVTRLAALLDYRLVPGVAASTYLAFTLEKDKEVQIPLGIRVQSVPGQSEKPQKFETVQDIAARADINRLKIYPQPQSHNPLEKGNPVGNGTSGYLDLKAFAALSPGDQFVIFSKSVSGIFSTEDKEVIGFKQYGGLTALVWKPEIQSSDMNLENSYAYKFVQKYRLFGHNAPKRYLHSYPDKNGEMKWIWVNEGESADEEIGRPEYTFEIPPDNAKRLNLDAVYDDLKKGTEILICPNRSFALVTIITEVRQVSESYGPMSATVSEITIKSPITDKINLREAEIYKLDGKISFFNYCYPDNIAGNSFYLPTNQAEKIELNRALIIGDENGMPQLATVTGVGSIANHGLKSITIDEELSPPLDSKTAFIYGNVAQATHGETVKDEVLGDGDASIGLQSFPISNSPVTFVHQAKSPHGAANTLLIRVDGILWHEANNLYGHFGNERIYTSEINSEGKTQIRFGDGQNGARLSSGNGNVTATYRKGSGREGNVKANTLKTLLDRPLGLKSVINPIAAEGGDNQEGLEDARKNAPNTVRTFERIVSLRDFEDAAREFKGVAKARSNSYWDGEEQAVILTVAGVDDADMDPILQELVGYLNVRRDRNRKLRVKVRRKMPLQMMVEIKSGSDFLHKDVQTAVTNALKEHLAFENLNLGQSIHLSDLYLAIQCVAGVVAARIIMLQFKDLSYSEQKKRLATFHTANGVGIPDSVQSHLYISSEELIAVENPETDIIVNLWSGQ